MKIHFIIHEAYEAPGAYESWAKKAGHQLTYSRLYLGDKLPTDVDTFDWLIIMGGPQSPDTINCPYFDSKAEEALILAAAKADKIVLGICLGAQLLGEALGAHFEHSPQKEIGKFPIYLTEKGKNHPLFSHFTSPLNVGHWHNDMPGLTAEAEVIAYSEGCPREIIAYGPHLFGFQSHLEFTAELVDQLIPHSLNDLLESTSYPFVDSIERLKTHDFSEMNQMLFTFLDKLAVTS